MPIPQSYGGIVPPVCTPFTAEGEIDRGSLETLIAFLLEGGIHGLFVLGSSGEMAALSDRQREEVLEITVGTVAGQVPVLAGVIDMGTVSVVEHSRIAEKLGADAVVATGPYYIRPNHEEIMAHFRMLHDAIEIPIFAYDVPANVQTMLALPTVMELAREGLVAGLKDSSGNEPNFRAVVMETRDIDGFSTFTGGELTVDYALMAGADGCVPGLGNVDPAGYVRLYDLVKAGDLESARAEQERLIRLFSIIGQATPGRTGFTAAALGGFKTALMLRGVIETNVMAPPMISLNDEEAGRIRQILVEAGLL